MRYNEINNHIVYRAMSEEEAKKTLADKKPFFRKRFKFFSEDLSFIETRVRDGKFAHSNFKENSYNNIVSFEILDGFENFTKLNNKELMLDVRKLPLVKLGEVKIVEQIYENIMELSRPEYHRPYSGMDNISAQDKLLDAGWEILGHGSYADVYHKDGMQYVLKVFCKDNAYLDFIKLVLNNTNEHFPKFYGKLIKVTPKYYAIRMEKLEKFSNNSLVETIWDYLYFRNPNYPITDNILKDKNYIKSTNIMNEPENSTLKQALDLIIPLTEYHGTDIKNDNIMLRGNTVVLIDPLC